MLWVRDVPLHEGHIFDLRLRDLLDLDLFLARYEGSLRHWWQIPATVDDVNELAPATRQYHPEAMLLLAVRVWGSYRASGRSESLEAILDSGLEWDQVWVTAEDGKAEADKLPRGFRAGNVQQEAPPDVEGMDLVREVNRRLLGISHLFSYTLDQVYGLSLYAWLGIAAAVDAWEESRRG